VCSYWLCYNKNCLPGLPVKKRTMTRRMKRLTCQQCGEKFKYRYQLTRHENRNHKQDSSNTAKSDAVPASGEGEIDCSFLKFSNHFRYLRFYCYQLSASGYASKHILSWSPRPEIGSVVEGVASSIKLPWGCMSGLTIALVSVAAAGLLVIQLEAWVRGDQRFTKGLIKSRIRQA